MRPTGAWIAMVASASMLRVASPDDCQELPSWLTNTPLSVPAATIVREKLKTRTCLPSRPAATDHVVPPSWLTSPPEPRVPASTNPELNGLKTIVVKAALPVCTEVHVEPPSVLLCSEPSELPAISSWLLEGSTASAKIAVRP